MKGYSCCCLAALLCAWPIPALADDAHEHGSVELGAVDFPTTCSAAVQPEFERGVAMLHSFWFPAAARTFRAVLQQDPGCAIADWGLAVTLMGNLLVGPPAAADAKAGAQAIADAQAIGAKSQRERDWIDAAGAWYRDYATVPAEARARAYNDAMAKVAARYPDDEEAQIYHALALQIAAPTDDRTYAYQRQAADILEQVYARHPQHPGAAHYLIHAYDYPPLAAKGLEAARRYATIAPAAPHARHMPSHIYTMLGMWEESIKSNMSSLEVMPEYYHAWDFAVYAQLQLGQDAQARAAVDKALAMAHDKPPVNLGYANSLVALPVRLALERGDWKAAAALPVVTSDWPYAASLCRFSRGLGMARTGDLAGARQEVEVLQAIRAALEKSGAGYWAARTDEEIWTVSAWIEQSQGHPLQAEQWLRKAADSEDASVKNVAMENRLFPLRESLGELLALQGKPQGALAEYEASLHEYPNRYRGLYGAARSAEAAGQRELARDYYARLVTLTAHADSARPEMAHAREFIATK